MNYYENQLSNVNTKSEFAPKIKVNSGEGNGETKWMDVNKESAEALVKWLTANFIK